MFVFPLYVSVKIYLRPYWELFLWLDQVSFVFKGFFSSCFALFFEGFSLRSCFHILDLCSLWLHLFIFVLNVHLIYSGSYLFSNFGVSIVGFCLSLFVFSGILMFGSMRLWKFGPERSSLVFRICSSYYIQRNLFCFHYFLVFTLT